VNDTDAVSLTGLPRTVTEYRPGTALELTVKEATAIVPVPDDIVQLDELMRVEGPVAEMVHDVSVKAKTEVDVTWTIVPPPPASGVKAITGAAATGVGWLNEVQAKNADTTKNTVIANLERRILNSEHTTLWRLALFHNI